ncbi:MAG: hypothetical protein H8D56_26930 [Planctomycetes bacterium]|nr:hypothetical protein [Planctomycetota bacterium]MBL7146852.1 hypothetical protein [Phycisphaerae bacterium]
MNKQRTAKVNPAKTTLLIMAVLIILSGSAMAQQSLQGLAQESGTDWLAGRWAATTDDGTEITLVYQWILDGHAIIVDMKMGEYASHGMIYYIPDDDKATAISVDNRGGRAKGTWQAQGDKLVSKNERIDAEGNAQKSGAVYTKVDNKTIKIALYGLNDYDELSDEPWFSMDFKRQAKKTTKPAAKQKVN